MPPAILSAGSEMPSACRSAAPAKANTNISTAATAVPRHAIERRSSADMPRVSVPAITATPTGSSTTNKVTKLEARAKSISVVSRQLSVFSLSKADN